ncbi:AMP-binding enzyme family protein [Theileria parva strain Muguga]|uniref:AMP-binding enzyme family protein n=1 Tax=Theileria parva strain Muguga TaxID=333668 RepID=UPI001C61B858|nr:AMP-binding enzyme family protein [Theileria parva strain Muguga]EAN33363.2 AMP-binding enzyme family protein [Theileria parva strain Muguga]
MVKNEADSPGFYSVPIPGTEEEGFSPVYRHPKHEKILGASDFGDFKTSWDLFQAGLRRNPDAECVGKRKRLPDGKLGDFEFNTYSEFFKTTKAVGSSLVHHNLVKEQRISQSSFQGTCKLVGLFLPSCEEWLLLEQACYGYGYTLVPIYTTLGTESILFVLTNTGLELLFCTEENAEKLFEVLSLSKTKLPLRNLVLVNSSSVSEKLVNNPYNLKFMLWSDFLQKGMDTELDPTPGDPDSLNIISYTSGTTGSPKGVMITHKNFIDTVLVTIEGVCRPMGMDEQHFSCHLSYLPMAHMFEKDFVNAVFYLGGKIGIYSGDVKLIMDDLQTLKPTLFISVPRLFQRIHDKILSGVQTKSALARHLFSRGLESKINRIRNNGVYTHKFYDKLIFDKVNKLMGGNLKWLFVGSSCLSEMVIDRVRAMIGKPLFWGYGLTECCAGAFVQNIHDRNPLNLGGPSPGFQFRIRSIPELNYFVDKKPIRGELVMKGTNVSMGYFKMEEMTKEVFRDGWLYTGDVVELMDNGSVKVIDRIKQVFKLSQGEYVAPEFVESALNSCIYIAQSYVVGNSDENYPVAIIVPDEEALQSWKKTHGLTKANLTQLAKDPLLKQFLFNELESVMTSSNVKGYNRVKEIYIHDELFSVENNLLTVTFKLKRNFLRQKFENEITQMYASLRNSNTK